MLLYSCSSGSGGRGTVSFRTDVIESGDNSVFIQVAADGDWTLGLDFGGEAEWAQLQRVSGTGSSNSIILFCETNWSRASRSLTVTADFGGNTDSAVLTQLGAEETLEPDPEYPGLESDPLRTWMELPEMRSEDGCAWVYHDMRIGDRTVRNYSIFYDAANMLSRWVAYPLNAGLIGSGSRHDQFEAVDPKIPAEYQPYTAEGWGVGSYDRGHQLPAADRYHTYDADRTLDAHRATFYPTNISPELYLHTNTWEIVENALSDRWTCSDTTYVVTGCYYGDDEYELIDASSWGSPTDGKSKTCIMPVARYRVILKTRSGNTGKPVAECSADELISIGFWFPQAFNGQKVYEENDKSQWIFSVADIEKKIGGEFSFFPTVPEEVKQQRNLSDWGL